MSCKKRCCVVSEMQENLIKILNKEFTNDKEYKLSYTTTNSERIHVHLSVKYLRYEIIKQIEDLHYNIVGLWCQAYSGISFAVIPNEYFFQKNEVS